ncbi:MAG: hypothetical protein KF730_17310 [Sphingomonas sp.]|uniref:hypothetical protein n=1 Tax=Sphingomonas sp. TaxID=28214 RepID=UPI0025D2FD8D|nr:hypothetical protein [Sphingomonas sp.]MBX3566321.1 hypothetical protein [Sphingomonas sp.]
MATQFSTIDGLKRAAKKAKRDLGMTHTQALDHVARAGGFHNFIHATRTIADASPPRFPVIVSQYWFDRESRARGTERLVVHLSQPLTTLVRPHQLKGYLGGSKIIGEDHLDGYDRGEDQDHARNLACRLARALQFMDATGLKPSSGKRFYPKGSWYNRPPGVDHDHGWFEPETKTYLFTDEPYGVGPETARQRADWCELHDFEILKSERMSVYGYGTELYLIAKRGTTLDLAGLLARLEASPPPISDKEWDRHAAP